MKTCVGHCSGSKDVKSIHHLQSNKKSIFNQVLVLQNYILFLWTCRPLFLCMKSSPEVGNSPDKKIGRRLWAGAADHHQWGPQAEVLNSSQTWSLVLFEEPSSRKPTTRSCELCSLLQLGFSPSVLWLPNLPTSSSDLFLNAVTPELLGGDSQSPWAAIRMQLGLPSLGVGGGSHHAWGKGTYQMWWFLIPVWLNGWIYLVWVFLYCG